MDNFKDLGITRKVDELGRIVLPSEARKTLNVGTGDSFSIFVDEANDLLILKPAEVKCTFCGATENLRSHAKRNICPDCLDSIKNIQ